MYEFLVLNAAGIRSKHKILFILCVCMLCIVLAVAAPLRVYAVGTVLSTIVTMVLSSLAFEAGVAVATALGVEVCVAFLIGLGVSITVAMLSTAIQYNIDNGNWAYFINQCQDNFSVNAGKIKAASVTAYLSAKNWIMENIVGHFTETETSDTVANTIYNGVATPTYPNNYPDWVQLNGVQLGTFELTQADLDDIFNSGQPLVKTLEGEYVNPDTNETVTIRSVHTFSYWGNSGGRYFNHYQDDYLINGSNNLKMSYYEFYKNVKLLGTWSCYYPIYVEDRNGLYMFTTWNNAASNLPFSACTYNDMELQFNNTYKNITCKVGSDRYAVNVIKGDNTISTWQYGFNGFASDVFLNGNTVSIVNSGLSDVVTSPSRETTVTNRYYNPSHDVVGKVGDIAGDAVTSGAITNTEAGAIGFTVTDAASVGAITDASVVSDVAAVSELDMSAALTEVVDVPVLVALQLAGNNIKIGFTDLQYKFPFDVIYSVADWLQALVTDGEPLRIQFDLNNPIFNQVYHVDINFNQYQTLVTVGNWIVLVSVAIGCLLATRKAFTAF